MKKLFLSLLACLIFLVLVLIVNALLWPSKQINVSRITHSEPLPGHVTRICQAIQYQTISYDDHPSDSSVFKEFEKFLEVSFPLVHSKLTKENMGGSNLIYHWEGSDKSLPAVMLLAHQDVVPAETNTWTSDPFKGSSDSSFIYGRGCLDDKGSLLGILEAAELLLTKGFTPKRSLYFAFGHDEEKGGRLGAKLIANVFKERNIAIDFILDEGGVIITGAAPGISKPLAVVGIAEKGYLSVEMTATAQAGHTSMPPKDVAITKLSKAIMAINGNPFEGKLTGATKELFNFAGPEMSFPFKLVFANQWLFEPIVRQILSGSPSTNATIKTTTAFTILKAGTKDNVLPTQASAVVNLRIIPGESTKSVLARLKEIVKDSSISFKVLAFSSEPSQVSDPNAQTFSMVNKTIREVFPDCIVAPYLVVAATDARYYAGLTKNIYRFFPARLNKEELKMIHGANERLSISNYKEIINFYQQLVVNSTFTK